MIPLFVSILLQVCSSYSDNIVSFFAATPEVWFPVVMVAITVMISITALVYIISPLIGRNDIRAWARAKIYDAAVTVIFAIIFLSFSTMLLCLNPTPSYSSLGILPHACDPTVSTNNPSSSNIADIYGVSVCDIYNYNQDLADFSNAMFYLSIIGGVSPTIPVAFTLGGVGVTFDITILPIVFVHQYIIPYLTLYYAAAVASFVQQSLLNAAMLIFSIFIIIGLIARSFGVTKSFGGAMIAFALGLGVIYPLMVSLTYGFLDVIIYNIGPAFLHLPLGISVPVPLNTLYNYVFTDFLKSSVDVLTLHGSQALQTLFLPIITPLITYAGFVGAGLIIIPLLNLMVVDAFIVDFSRAIGERMDLFSILTRIV